MSKKFDRRRVSAIQVVETGWWEVKNGALILFFPGRHRGASLMHHTLPLYRAKSPEAVRAILLDAECSVTPCVTPRFHAGGGCLRFSDRDGRRVLATSRPLKREEA